MATQIDLIVVGKYKDKNFEALEGDYSKRFKSIKLNIHEVKALAQDKNIEGKNVLKKIQDITKGQPAHIITLEEKGKELGSVQFSNWIFNKLEAH